MNIKNNIIHIVSSLNTGGAEKFVKNLSAQQKINSEQVKIISFGNSTDDFQPQIEKNLIKVVNLSGGMFSRLKLLLKEINKAGVIHIHSPAVIRALLPIFPLLWNKNILYTIHGEIDPPEKYLVFSHKMAKFYLKVIVAVSESSKQSVQTRYGWNPLMVNVIKNGVSVIDHPVEFQPDKLIRLGTVSRLIPLKNIELLFTAINLLNVDIAKKFSVNIYGDGPERNHLEKEAQKIIHDISIDFKGNVLDEIDIYNGIDILIMCSKSEGLPMSILEAMGKSIPVISTSVGAIPEVIQHKKSGWLYNVGNASELKEILELIATTPELVDEYGRKAKSYVIENYSINAVCKEYQNYYLGDY